MLSKNADFFFVKRQTRVKLRKWVCQLLNKKTGDAEMLSNFMVNFKLLNMIKLMTGGVGAVPNTPVLSCWASAHSRRSTRVVI